MIFNLYPLVQVGPVTSSDISVAAMAGVRKIRTFGIAERSVKGSMKKNRKRSNLGSVTLECSRLGIEVASFVTIQDLLDDIQNEDSLGMIK